MHGRRDSRGKARGDEDQDEDLPREVKEREADGEGDDDGHLAHEQLDLAGAHFAGIEGHRP